MRDLREVIRESNRRRKGVVIETPLDLIRILNRERRKRATAERLIRRVRGL